MRKSWIVTLVALAFMGVLTDGEAQEPTGAQATALAHVEAMEQGIREMSMTLWDYSEIALRETKSAELLAGRLEEEGFRVRRGVAGMPTAFIAEYGSGSPVIGILAEYDALPGVGNAPVPRKSPRDDGHAHGQGCGHNLFGAASVGAALALKRTMDDEGLEGTIRLYGTPAEETVVGKVYMAREGVFDDLDVALHWHPGLETETDASTSLAMNNFEVEFRGQAAHGAADPWNGRSALDGVELMNDGVNLMREHVRPTTRIHYVIPSAGEAPNVVPEYARVWYYVRDTDREGVEEYYDWILKIAEGAALGTRTEHAVRLITGVHAMLLNRPLQEAVQANLELVGPPDFTAEDQAFARALQRSLGIEEEGLMDSILPLPDEDRPASGGSTDVAEVSRIVPTMGFGVTSAPAGVPWHSWATSASHGTPMAQKAAVVAAKVLALTGTDLLTDPELVARAQADFDERMGGEVYESPLPPDQAPPVPEEVSTGG